MSCWCWHWHCLNSDSTRWLSVYLVPIHIAFQIQLLCGDKRGKKQSVLSSLILLTTNGGKTTWIERNSKTFQWQFTHSIPIYTQMYHHFIYNSICVEKSKIQCILSNYPRDVTHHVHSFAFSFLFTHVWSFFFSLFLFLFLFLSFYFIFSTE